MYPLYTPSEVLSILKYIGAVQGAFNDLGERNEENDSSTDALPAYGRFR